MSAAGFGPRCIVGTITFCTYTPIPGGGLLSLIASESAGTTQLRLDDGKPGDAPMPRNGPSWADGYQPDWADLAYVGPAALAQGF